MKTMTRKALLLAALAPFAANAADSNCTAQLSRIDALVTQYSKSAQDSKSDEADATYKNIQRLIFSEIGETGPCAEAAIDRYALDSYLAYDPTKYSYKNDSGGYYRGVLQNVDLSAPRPPQATDLLVSTLLDQKKVTFLTAAKRGELGGAWAERVAGKDEFTTIGAYDCAETRIYLDPMLRPFDLAATFYHELDHLVRDKQMKDVPEKLRASSASSAGVNWQLYNLADEADAIATSSMIFIAAHGLETSAFSDKSQWRNSNFDIRHRYYKIDQDFSLYSKSGAMAKYVALHSYSPPREIAGYLFGGDPSQDNYGYGIHWTPPIDTERHLRDHFYSTIASAYFPGEKIDLHGAKDFEEYFNIPASSLPGVNSWSSYASATTAMVSSGPSPICQAYLDSLTQGEVQGYLGTRFSKRGVIRESIRPCVNFRKSL